MSDEQLTEMGIGLTPEQASAYKADGFYYPITVMTAAHARRCVEELADVEARHGPMHYRVKPYLLLRSAYEIATSPAVLDCVESVLGPDILLWDSSYVVKEPNSRKFVSWHQDLTYWGLALDSDDDIVSVWVALSPATPLNGSMRFVRGSHRAGRFEHADTYDDDNILHRGQSIGDAFDASMIEQSELAAGQASLHHGWVVHASGPNDTDDRRVGIVFNYIKPSVRQVVGYVESATLVRGQDNCGHFIAEPVCSEDFAPANVEFQLDVEKKKRDVYDTA